MHNISTNYSRTTTLKDSPRSALLDNKVAKLNSQPQNLTRLRNALPTQQELLNNPEMLGEINQRIEESIAQLPDELQTSFQNFRHNCQDIVSNYQKQLTSDDPELLLLQQVPAPAVDEIYASTPPMTQYLSHLDANLQLPFAILSMQVLSSSIEIMASQSNLAVKKMEAMTKLIEQLQAMTSLLTEITNQLNNAYNSQMEQDANAGKTPNSGLADTIDWNDAVNNGHGQTKQVQVYDLSYMMGSHAAFNPNHFKDDPLGKFLFDNGYVELNNNLCGCGNAIHPTQSAIDAGIFTEDGRFYPDKLPAGQKEEFMNAYSWSANNSSSHYSDWAEEYSITSESSAFPNIYDSTGKLVKSDDAILNNSLVIAADKIPPELQELFIPLYNSPDGSGTPDYYAISDTALQDSFSALVNSYQLVMGETPEDFNEKLVGSVTGTIKDIENTSKILEQKIQYIQQKQAALAKTPENAKEDSNRKLEMFTDALHSTTY